LCEAGHHHYAPGVLIVTMTEALPLGAVSLLESARRSKGYSRDALAEVALIHPNTLGASSAATSHVD
jgi:hypothetical protein